MDAELARARALNDRAEALCALVAGRTERGEGEDPSLTQAAAALIAEAAPLLPADDVWRIARGTGWDEALKHDLTRIAADGGSPDAAYALHEGSEALEERLLWLLRAEALGHPEALSRARALRAEGLIGPPLPADPVGAPDGDAAP